MNKLSQIEKEYSLKLQEAKQEENYDKIQILLWELKILRKFYKNGKFRNVISG
jgi:hypothetical protein